MRIKRIMAEKGVTSKALAKQIGITEMGMSHIVTGKSIPNGKTIMDIAKALGVTCGELFDDYKVPDTHSVIIDGIEYVPKVKVSESK